MKMVATLCPITFRYIITNKDRATQKRDYFQIGVGSVVWSEEQQMWIIEFDHPNEFTPEELVWVAKFVKKLEKPQINLVKKLPKANKQLAKTTGDKK